MRQVRYEGQLVFRLRPCLLTPAPQAKLPNLASLTSVPHLDIHWWRHSPSPNHFVWWRDAEGRLNRQIAILRRQVCHARRLWGWRRLILLVASAIVRHFAFVTLLAFFFPDSFRQDHVVRWWLLRPVGYDFRSRQDLQFSAETTPTSFEFTFVTAAKIVEALQELEVVGVGGSHEVICAVIGGE